MRAATRTATAAVIVLLAGTFGPAPATAAPVDSRQLAYRTAAGDFGVPESVLLAVSYLQSRWDTNAGTPSTVGGYGPMHLTDVPSKTDGPAPADRRGDAARPALVSSRTSSTTATQTLDRAAALTGLDPQALRIDPTANIRGGAALLARYQRELGAPLSSDPDDWYGAVARYPGTGAGEDFADEVYAVLAEGVSRTTDDGHPLRLAATNVKPPVSQKHRPDGVECPATLSCEWIPAPYEQTGPAPNNYGNHDLSDRPARQKIEYIVIHDTETSYEDTIRLVQDPTYVSWNYTIRSADGHTAQHVKAKDAAWHAGNWYVNAKAIGIEHEGYAAQGTWFTEAMYRSSAKLVRYLALRNGIPLDRTHIIGHDNVPGTLPTTVRGMHWDPGPYWDWNHYFNLLHAPIAVPAVPRGGTVVINPDLRTNKPRFTGCADDGTCPALGSSAVVLHSAPSDTAPLVKDLGLHPDGSPSTMDVSDHGARASAGQRFAVADRRGDWTAIWYLGQVAWFRNPRSAPTATPSIGLVVTPKPGRATVPVYGRAYPEQAAYPEGVPYQAITPLQYTFSAGERYTVGNLLPSEYYRATTFAGTSPGDWTVVRGATRYVQIQFGHRIMFVNRDDVLILPA